MNIYRKELHVKEKNTPALKDSTDNSDNFEFRDGLRLVTVRANWRIIFKFDGENAILVDYIDYH